MHRERWVEIRAAWMGNGIERCNFGLFWGCLLAVELLSIVGLDSHAITISLPRCINACAGRGGYA